MLFWCNHFPEEKIEFFSGLFLLELLHHEVPPDRESRSSKKSLGGDYMIPVSWDKILSRFAGIPGVL